MSMLFNPIRAGRFELLHRIVMAPLTRSRAAPRNVPTKLMACYYAQRASAAMIISEATQVSMQGQGYQSPAADIDVPQLEHVAQEGAGPPPRRCCS